MSGILKLERCRLVDRYGNGAGGRIAAVSGMQHDRFRMLAIGHDFPLFALLTTIRLGTCHGNTLLLRGQVFSC